VGIWGEAKKEFLESMNGMAEEKEWDVFISHASEDKDSFVRPLAVALQSLGVSVWYDEFSLRLGDSLCRSIDKGLASSKFGLVVVSASFLSKPWPEYELRGLVAREVNEGRVILPIWHGVNRKQVLAFSPPLADKIAIKTSGASAQDISIRLLRELRPDLYAQHDRSYLERLASGEAVRELQEGIERMQEELTAAQEEIAQYRCPYCRAPELSRNEAPLDGEERDWGSLQDFECGYRAIQGFVERPCPKDPRFPKFDDYELIFEERADDARAPWYCYAEPKTGMARRVHIMGAPGKTREQAAARVRESYEVCARWRRW
jgi:hypothetical protein